MTHRHLLPSEVDILLDGEIGFGVAPLRAHLDACADCRRRVEDARRIVDALEELPRFAPPPRFAESVMARVQVIEPWYVALRDAALLVIPRSRPLRAVMAASAALTLGTLSAGALWLGARVDIAVYLANVASTRAREAAIAGLRTVIGGVFGDAALDALRAGGLPWAIVASAVLVASAGLAAAVFRAIASAARGARE
jgi:hypothetical protein